MEKESLRDLRNELRELYNAFEKSEIGDLAVFAVFSKEQKALVALMLEPKEAMQDGIVVAQKKAANHTQITHSFHGLMARAGRLCQQALPNLVDPVSYADLILGQDGPAFAWVRYIASSIRGYTWTKVTDCDHAPIIQIDDPRQASMACINDLLSQLPTCDSKTKTLADNNDSKQPPDVPQLATSVDMPVVNDDESITYRGETFSGLPSDASLLFALLIEHYPSPVSVSRHLPNVIPSRLKKQLPARLAKLIQSEKGPGTRLVL